MPRFRYRAKKGLKETVEGVLEGSSRDEVLERLTQQGLFPISIELDKVLRPQRESQERKRRLFSWRVSRKEILLFIQKLATFSRAKVDLLKALTILYNQTDNLRFKDVLLSLSERLKEGKSFSESLQAFPQFFPPLFISIIRAGEASGRLDKALEEINSYLQREDELRSKIKASLAYPLLLLGVGLITIFVLISFVIPKLKILLLGLKKELPLVTRLIIKVSDLSKESWYIFLGVAISGGFILYWQRRNPLLLRFNSALKRKIPIIGRIIYNQEISRLSKSLSLLLRSGVSALASLKITSSGIQDISLKREMEKVWEGISQGKTLYESMSLYTSLPSFFVKLVEIGEESGRLDEILEEAGNSYARQIEQDIKVVTSLVEPLLILGLGLILGSIILSILLPIFQLTRALK